MSLEQIKSIISNRQIKTLFQPIVSLRDGGVLGYEALSRVTCQNRCMTVEAMFELARKQDLLWDLEYLMRTVAIESASEKVCASNSRAKIFLNVSPVIIHDPRFRTGFTKHLLNDLNIKAKNVIFEITEKNAVRDIEGFKATISHYKDQNFNIAIDDVGAGYSGLNLISEIAPHYLKLDMNLIRNIHNDRLKQGLIRGIVEFSSVSNVLLIAEGIESQEELEAIVHFGVQYGQGYLIQRPHEEIREIDEVFLETLRSINFKRNHILHRSLPDIYIKNICTKINTVSPHEKILDVYQHTIENPEFSGLCVVENNIPVGIISRENVLTKLSGRFGFSLYSSKTISALMDSDFLSVDETTPINIVSNMAMTRPHSRLYDFIVVTSRKKYLGIVTIKNLLLKTTEIEVSAAKHQNPLSGLPGNFIIEQKLTQCIGSSAEFSVAYLDLDNFKAYNDIYGFESGDCVLKLLADKLEKLICETCFIGHVGGDDFIAIVYDHVGAEFFQEVLREFESEVLRFYSETDVANGYILSKNRDGVDCRFPLLSTTCVVINNKSCSYASIYTLSEKLAELKKQAKGARQLSVKNCLPSTVSRFPAREAS